MKYQLVLQFRANSIQDCDRLAALEGYLDEDLEDAVDEHDFGSGEFNIFLITNDAVATFAEVQAVLKKRRIQESMKAAYRDLTSQEFVILWPPGLKEFQVT